MSDSIPGDTATPESAGNPFPPLCVLCSNTILEEQESGISAAGARYHVDCVNFEAGKASEAQQDARRDKLKKAKGDASGETQPSEGAPGRPDQSLPGQQPSGGQELPEGRPNRPDNSLPDHPEGKPGDPDKPTGDRPFLGDKPGPG